jgi:hypothetical protein
MDSIVRLDGLEKGFLSLPITKTPPLGCPASNIFVILTELFQWVVDNLRAFGNDVDGSG